MSNTALGYGAKHRGLPGSERSEDAFCEAESRPAQQGLHIAESDMAQSSGIRCKAQSSGTRCKAPRLPGSERSKDAFCEAESRPAQQGLHIAESDMAQRLWDTVRSTEGSQGPSAARMHSAKQNQDFRRKACKHALHAWHKSSGIRCKAPRAPAYAS